MASVPVLRGVVSRPARMAIAVPGLPEVPRVRVASRVVRVVVPVAREHGVPGIPAALRGVVPVVRAVPVVPVVRGAGKPGILRPLPSVVPARVVPRTRWMMIAA